MNIFKVTTGDVLGPLINITQGYHLIKQDSKRPSEEVRQHSLEIIKSLSQWSKCSIFQNFSKFPDTYTSLLSVRGSPIIRSGACHFTGTLTSCSLSTILIWRLLKAQSNPDTLMESPEPINMFLAATSP